MSHYPAQLNDRIERIPASPGLSGLTAGDYLSLCHGLFELGIFLPLGIPEGNLESTSSNLSEKRHGDQEPHLWVSVLARENLPYQDQLGSRISRASRAARSDAPG
jgi:hypothetical protein